MLLLLNKYFRKTTAWYFLFISGISFEALSLFFQYNLQIPPCSLNIYQRVAMLGIILAALIGCVSAEYLFSRLFIISLWLYSAYKGFQLAYFQATLQFESVTMTIDYKDRISFPHSLPLDEWMPSFFYASTSCIEKRWTFLTIEMSQWLVIIFLGYLILGLLALIAQFFPYKENSLWGL